MAEHRPLFGQVEREMMENIFSPEVLRENVPGMGDVLDGASHLRAMHEEIGIVGKFRAANGFSADRSVQRIAKIDTNVMVMLDHLHDAGCMCGKGLWGSDGHRAWFLEWLAGPGRAFDLRTKVTL
jgi:hypothetical protein